MAKNKKQNKNKKQKHVVRAGVPELPPLPDFTRMLDLGFRPPEPATRLVPWGPPGAFAPMMGLRQACELVAEYLEQTTGLRIPPVFLFFNQPIDPLATVVYRDVSYIGMLSHLAYAWKYDTELGQEDGGRFYHLRR